ncbi:DNA repair protein [Veillonella sp. CHU110]|uniref:Y-family DNA polymerase n=1 Tax=Veillonella sp. CHU110 TaxID=2490947 RepID=UPI000F8E7E0C|nr:DNA repair protein [Veillonella sp. CHU110]
MAVYMCLDLKSFYASVECADLGVDPFTTPLVVADASRGLGAITLAISPALKALEVKNRCRLFEIPSTIEYIAVKPRMRRYMEVSASIYGVLLEYVAPEDIHVYSIDEYFIDVTPYSRLYKKSYYDLALLFKDKVLARTHIHATVGLGSNLFLAKVALDVLAKHAPQGIGMLNEESFKEKIWYHQPITDIWQIGKGIARRLHKYGVVDLHGITTVPEDRWYKEFGVNAELLIDHAWGRETCTMKEIHAYRPAKHSLSRGQILLRNYSYEECFVPLREMVESLLLELVAEEALTKHISLGVRYADRTVKGTGGSRRLSKYTCSLEILSQAVLELYKETVHHHQEIRQLSVGFDDLVNRAAVPWEEDLFSDDSKEEEKSYQVERTVLEIKERFGGNSILRASSLQEEGTMQFRNTLVGGHNAT